MRFANRTPRTFSTVDMPRKWSTRCTRSSGTSRASTPLRASAPAAPVPNGFSITRRVPSGNPMPVSASHAAAVIDGGNAK
jgi:hypothetical protein